MKLKLFLLLAVVASLSGFAQQSTTVKGKLVDASTGQPLAGATVMFDQGGTTAVTGPDGYFILVASGSGSDNLLVAAYGYNDLVAPVNLTGTTVDLGNLRLGADEATVFFSDDQQEMIFDESVLDDEEGNAQAVGVLSGASDNIYFNATNYDFSVMRFRVRGYNSEYNTMYINGIPFNDLARGRFSYSTLGGMNRAFRNRTNTFGLMASDYGFGDIGGSANISTLTSGYAPGFNGSVAYTNQ